MTLRNALRLVTRMLLPYGLHSLSSTALLLLLRLPPPMYLTCLRRSIQLDFIRLFFSQAHLGVLPAV